MVYFAYAVIVLTTGGFSAWAGGFALAILILPTILLTAEQALLGVSKAYREASYGLGATNFQTIWRVVLPDSLARHNDRHHARGGARGGRDRAPYLHCALQPVLDPIDARADGLVVRSDL